jgi:mannose-6-phosphate isomerase
MPTERKSDPRPWGGFRVLREAKDFKVKEVMVAPGRRLSLQYHRRRGEHWFVVRGQGVVTRGEEEIPVQPGAAVDLPAGTPHRVHNTGDELLVFIEVQRGDYFGEDDIKRLADDFGRADAPRAKKKTGHPSLR